MIDDKRALRDAIGTLAWVVYWFAVFLLVCGLSIVHLLILFWPLGVAFAALIGWVVTMFVINVVCGIKSDIAEEQRVWAEIERYR